MDVSPEVGSGQHVDITPKQHEQVLNLALDIC